MRHQGTNMRKAILLNVLVVSIVGAGGAERRIVSAEQSSPAPVMKPMLIATETEVVKFNEHGKIVWRTPSGVARDVWQLPNGNILFPFNQDEACGVREVTPRGTTAWEFKLPGQYVISCQRLPDGNTLVGASCRGEVLVVDPGGKILHTIRVRDKHRKHSTTIVRQVKSGNILVVEESSGYVTEYTLDGKIAWEYRPPFRPFGVARLHSGNTLISGQDGMVEVTPAKRIVWQLTRADVSAMGPRWFAGFRVLPSGNIMICNAGGAVPVFEVNRAKQVVWKTTLNLKQVGLAHGLYVLSR